MFREINFQWPSFPLPLITGTNRTLKECIYIEHAQSVILQSKHLQLIINNKKRLRREEKDNKVITLQLIGDSDRLTSIIAQR